VTKTPVLTGIAALVGFDPTDPAFRADPYPHYERLRENTPIFQSPLGFWLLTRYEECRSVLGDDRFGYPDGAQAAKTNLIAAGYSSQRNFFFFMNPPDHTRMRSIVREGLSPRVVHNLRSYVEVVANRLLDEALESGEEFDLMSSFAHSQPFGVICELLGVPDSDRARVMKLAQDYLSGIGPAFSVSQAQHKARDKALVQLNEYFGSLSVERRRKPADDLFTHLIDANDHDQMSADELLGTCVLLFVAGHSTTTNLIGNGALALLRHPDQLARFRAEPDLEGSAIEELLRYDVPTHQSFRIAREDVRLNDEFTIREGEQVLAIRGSANRDPSVFSDPDRLDLGREDNRHLSFGVGRHICIGSALARMQGRIALRTLFTRAPNLTLATDDLQYHESLLVRGLKELPVVAETAGKRRSSGNGRTAEPTPSANAE
jgi:cytochrome P450